MFKREHYISLMYADNETSCRYFNELLEKEKCPPTVIKYSTCRARKFTMKFTFHIYRNLSCIVIENFNVKLDQVQKDHDKKCKHNKKCCKQGYITNR